MSQWNPVIHLHGNRKGIQIFPDAADSPYIPMGYTRGMVGTGTINCLQIIRFDERSQNEYCQLFILLFGYIVPPIVVWIIPVLHGNQACFCWAHLCSCTVGSYASLCVCLSLDQNSLDNNSYLRKYCTLGHGIWYGDVSWWYLGRPWRSRS